MYEEIKKAVKQIKKLGGHPDVAWFSPYRAAEIKKDPHYDPESNTIYGLEVVSAVLPIGMDAYVGEKGAMHSNGTDTI